MTVHKNVCLASDNWAPAHPLVVKAVLEANAGYADPYGADPWTEQAQQLIQQAVCRKPCKVFLIPTGTGANVFALKLACRPHESVLCTDISHIQYQESGAVEAIVGCKLLLVATKEGKITPEGVIKKIQEETAFGRHSTMPRVLSITQPTEAGTVYSLAELRELAKLCRETDLFLHIDGSRLYNAAAALGVGLDAIIEASSADLVSLGGTKNGLMGVESLLILNPRLENGSDYLQKQTLQLVSKMRYFAAQYIPFFTQDLWCDLAQYANQKAQEIASVITEIPSFSLSYPVETNQVFFTVPSPWVPLIQEKISCYLWNKERHEIRFITSWNTSEQDIKIVKSILKSFDSRLNQN